MSSNPVNVLCREFRLAPSPPIAQGVKLFGYYSIWTRRCHLFDYFEHFWITSVTSRETEPRYFHFQASAAPPSNGHMDKVSSSEQDHIVDKKSKQPLTVFVFSGRRSPYDVQIFRGRGKTLYSRANFDFLYQSLESRASREASKLKTAPTFPIKMSFIMILKPSRPSREAPDWP